MIKRILSLILALALALPPSMGVVVSANAAPASATHRWVNPGRHPLADNRPAVMNDAARRANFVRLGLSGDLLERVMAATSIRGEMRDLVDGEELGDQLYQSGRIVTNIVVAFGTQRVNRQAERWHIVLDDGTVIDVTLPYVCHNLSVRITPPPPAPDPCAYIRFSVRSPDEVRAHVPVYGGGTSDRCYGYRKVGQSDWQDITPGCPRGPCNMSGADRMVAPRARTFTGTIEGLTPGEYEIRVERAAFAENDDARLGVCLENRQPGAPGGRMSSYTAVLGPTHYRLEGGRWVARIAYTDADVPEGVTQVEPGGVYFYQTR